MEPHKNLSPSPGSFVFRCFFARPSSSAPSLEFFREGLRFLFADGFGGSTTGGVEAGLTRGFIKWTFKKTLNVKQSASTNDAICSAKYVNRRKHYF